jgi:hypothetical protein
MPRFQFELAEAASDAELRQLLANIPMEGSISIAFAREPSYFDAAEVDGDFVQVVAVRDRATGRIIGMGSRAISTHFVNGMPQAVGYLSGLRLLPEFRGQARLLARGFALFRELHQDRRTSIYLTTIAEDNAPALRLLAANRANMPVYHYLGKYVTLVLRRLKSKVQQTAVSVRDTEDLVQIRTAHESDREVLGCFLNREGARRQFFPAFRSAELFASQGRLKNLSPGQTWLAFRRDELIGTLGLWDQRAFKQIHVSGYQPWTNVARPFYNAWARWRRAPQLPAPGSRLPAIYGALPVVQENDATVFERLLTSALAARYDDGDVASLLGLFETDPLLPVARQYATRSYVTNLYAVHWRDDKPDLEGNTHRIPYLELGCL